MRKVRAKVAHTIEPGCRYIHAGEEIDILDDQFDENVHEHLDPHPSKDAKGDPHLILPQGVNTPPRPAPPPADLQYSMPPKPKYPEIPNEFETDRPAIGPQQDTVVNPNPRSPSVASTPAQPPTVAPLSSPTSTPGPGSGLLGPEEGL